MRGLHPTLLGVPPRHEINNPGRGIGPKSDKGKKNPPRVSVKMIWFRAYFMAYGVMNPFL
jgi:hypothetical protein